MLFLAAIDHQLFSLRNSLFSATNHDIRKIWRLKLQFYCKITAIFAIFTTKFILLSRGTAKFGEKAR